MKQRAITSVYIVLASVLAILSKLIPVVGDYIFDIFILGVTIVAGIEICNMMEANKRKLNKLMASMYCILNYIVLLICQNRVEFYAILLIEVAVLVGYWIIALLIEFFKDQKTPAKQHLVTSLNTLLACIYPSFFFCLLLNFNHVDGSYAGAEYFSLAFIVLIFLITWLTDTFAYLVGRTFKGPKLAPKISPNKTISGAIGGLLGGIIGAMLIFLLVYNVPAMSTILSMYSLKWWHFLLIGMFGSMFGQMGDLFESKLKRNAGIKDSGNIFPGHGGMLDRIDAMIFISTFVYIVIFIILL